MYIIGNEIEECTELPLYFKFSLLNHLYFLYVTSPPLLF